MVLTTFLPGVRLGALGSGSRKYQPLQPVLSPVDPYEDGRISFKDYSVLADVITLNQHFRANGYKAIGRGKIYHGRFPDTNPGAWDEYIPKGTDPPAKYG